MSKDENITIVRDEDKKFIRDVTSLSPEKMSLVKGIVIGLHLQEKQQIPEPARM